MSATVQCIKSHLSVIPFMDVVKGKTNQKLHDVIDIPKLSNLCDVGLRVFLLFLYILFLPSRLSFVSSSFNNNVWINTMVCSSVSQIYNDWAVFKHCDMDHRLNYTLHCPTDTDRKSITCIFFNKDLIKTFTCRS